MGFHRAYRFPQQVRAIAYMEAIVQPLRWEDIAGAESALRAIRSDAGEQMILDDNFFVEVLLPASILRKLSSEEMAAYRAPFGDHEARQPTLQWPRQIPIEGDPADVTAIVEEYSRWLADTLLPKLLVIADPGAIIVGRAREFCRTWKNQQEITVPGIHFVQEDSPHEIGRALQSFITSLRPGN